MKYSINKIALFILLAFILTMNLYSQKPITPEALFSLEQLGSFSISPNGLFVVATISKPNIETNEMESHLQIMSAVSDNMLPVILQDKSTAYNPVWLPNGNGFAYIKVEDDAYHIYFVEITANGDRPTLGGLPRRIASFKEDISDLKFSPDGHFFSFVKSVKARQTVKEKYPNLPKANVRIYDSLPIRQWDVWIDENVSHIFYMPVAGSAADAKDIMPNDNVREIRGYSWAPDSKEIAYSTKKVYGPQAARSTNSEVYIYSLQGQTTTNITEGMKGYDDSPKYSPDGQFIAFKSQERPGFESDRIRLMLYNRNSKQINEVSKNYKQVNEVVTNFDQWVTEYLWSSDSKAIYLTATNKGSYSIFKADVNNNTIAELIAGQYDYTGLSLSADGQTLCFGRNNMIQSLNIFTANVQDANTTKSTIKQVTTFNERILQQFVLSTFEEKWVKTKDGKQLHCWVVYPPNFDKNKKYPMLTYCQGGPQQMVSQAFGYRWNMSLLAARGYVIVAPNRRGCPGFGQQWVDAITKDWGGKPMQDILDATDEMAKQPFIDKNKLAAIGASAGGFTAFWLAGHHKGRFKALMSHCGVFNFYSMYGATEELFFPDWEWGGAYWEGNNKKFYDKNSPNNFIASWNTPIIISTGEKDFRVPYSQSLEAFTAAQVKGIPSKLIVYPELNHFVGKTQEYIVWYNEVFDFFDKHLQNGGNK